MAITASVHIRSRVGPTIDVRYILKALGGSDMPTGTMVAYAGSEVPKGWLPCDGRAVSSAMFQELYAVIGTAYGQPRKLPAWQAVMVKMFGPSDSQSFRLPDMRGRVSS